jgi:hypothetical protein
MISTELLELLGLQGGRGGRDNCRTSGFGELYNNLC